MISSLLSTFDPGASARIQGNGSGTSPRPAINTAWQQPRRAGLNTQLQTLDAAELRERNECENIIRKGWNTFLEVGRALTKMRQKRLYRDHYRTFEEYCRRKWDFSKTHANRLIEAAAVADVLTPIGVKVKSESHVRALVWLPPQKIVAAWRKAEALAGGRDVTAKLLSQAAEEFRDDFTPAPGPAPSKKPGVNRVVLHCALKLIDRAEKAVRQNDPQTVLDALAHLRQRLLDC